MISLALFHPQKPAKAVWEALLWLSERCELEIRFSGGNLRFHFTAVYWSWEYLYDTTMLCKIFEGRVRKLLKRSSGAKIKYSFSRPRVAQYCVFFGWLSWLYFWVGCPCQKPPIIDCIQCFGGQKVKIKTAIVTWLEEPGHPLSACKSTLSAAS